MDDQFAFNLSEKQQNTTKPLSKMSFRLVDLAKPFSGVLPEVELPVERISFDDKVVYTIGAGVLYLFAQLPVYAAQTSAQSDPIAFLRPVFAAERNTLLEFGVFPIISSAIILQLCAGLKLIKVNFKKRADRESFQSLQKLFAIFQYLVLTVLFLSFGYFGYNLTIYQWILIIGQIVGTGIFFTLITEIIEKDYGFGSGSLSFVAVNIATKLVGDLVGFHTVKTSLGFESNGAFFSLVQNVKSKPFKVALWNSFSRKHLPNILQGYVSILVIAAVIYLQNLRIELPIKSTKVRAMNNVYPIKLLYTGALPLVFSYVVLFYINIVGFAVVNLLLKNDPAQILVKILGHYADSPFTNAFVVDSPSVLYYFQPSETLLGAVTCPLKTVFFTAFVVVSSGWFANTWSYISGSSPRDIALQFKEQGISIAGRRDVSISKELQRVIPVAAVSGAAILALVSSAGDIFGLAGGAPSLVVAVCVAFSFLEIIATEYQQAGGSSFSQIFGI